MVHNDMKCYYCLKPATKSAVGTALCGKCYDEVFKTKERQEKVVSIKSKPKWTARDEDNFQKLFANERI